MLSNLFNSVLPSAEQRRSQIYEKQARAKLCGSNERKGLPLLIASQCIGVMPDKVPSFGAIVLKQGSPHIIPPHYTCMPYIKELTISTGKPPSLG
jgi:hypothetical protein